MFVFFIHNGCVLNSRHFFYQGVPPFFVIRKSAVKLDFSVCHILFIALWLLFVVNWSDKKNTETKIIGFFGIRREHQIPECRAFFCAVSVKSRIFSMVMKRISFRSKSVAILTNVVARLYIVLSSVSIERFSIFTLHPSCLSYVDFKCCILARAFRLLNNTAYLLSCRLEEVIANR
jgi:hypothetical protein